MERQRLRCKEGYAKDQGMALFGVIVLTLLLSLLSAVLLQLAGQEQLSASAAKDAAVAQHIADAAADMVMAWFHTPQVRPPQVSAVLNKRHQTSTGSPSFFDPAGRSQFIGTVDRPDLVLNAAKSADDRILNDPVSGLFRSLQDVGTVRSLKVYAPTTPGLLSTVDIAVAPARWPSAQYALSMQLAAIDLPALRAGVQVGGNLGWPQNGQESGALVHWSRLSVGGNLVVQRLEDIPALTALASVSGQGYREVSVREDRWCEVWTGGTVQVMQPPVGESQFPPLPLNVHGGQNPTPGVRLDRWGYEQLKQIALRYGTYLVIDRNGLLYPGGVVEVGQGVSPDEYFRSGSAGDARGLIFIDTLDRTAPRPDNLGVLRLSAAYTEATLVVQGHVVLSPSSGGQSLSVLSPPQPGQTDSTSRIPVQLSGIHLNGALYAAGDITLDQSTRVFGAVVAEGTIVASTPGATLEVWYNHEMSQGLLRGLPVVLRAPGTWKVRYS